MTIEDWAAVSRHVKTMEEDDTSREREMGSVIEKIAININNDHGDASES
jgi:hypothetical protein